MAHDTDASGLTGTGWTTQGTPNPDDAIHHAETLASTLQQKGLAFLDLAEGFATEKLSMMDSKAKKVMSQAINGADRLIKRLSEDGNQHIDNAIRHGEVIANSFATSVNETPIIAGQQRPPIIPIQPEPTLSTPPTHIDCHSFLPPHLYAVGVREMYLWLCANQKEDCFFCLNQPGEAIVESTGGGGIPFITGDTPPNPIHIVPQVEYSVKRFHTIDKYSTWYRCEFAMTLGNKLRLNGIKIRALHHAIEQVGLSTSAIRGVPTSLADFVAQSGGQ